MYKSQLIEILKTLTPKEIKELSDYVRSPFFNKNEGVVNLFEYIKTFYPDFPEEKIVKEKVYSEVFPGAGYNDGFMRKCMFTLSSLAENYIIYKGIDINSLTARNALLKEYYSRENASLFNKTYREIRTKLKDAAVLSAEYFYNGYMSSFRNISFAAEHKLLDFGKFVNKNNIFEPFEYLSAHFLYAVMNLYEYYLNTQRMFKIKIDDAYFEKLINAFDPAIMEQFPLLKIHNYLLRMLKEPDNEQNFRTVKTLIRENEDKIEQHQVENIYVNLQNYCMRKIRSNRTEYSRELFEIYKMELENTVYSENNNISIVLYRNIVFTALQEKEIEFAENFVEKYRKFLSEENRDSNYHYVKAHIALKKKAYDEMGNHLGKIKNLDELLKNDLKSMYVLLYYETKAVSQFYSLIDTFRHNLRDNKKLSDERLGVYNTFINFANRLHSLRDTRDASKIFKLRKDIEKTGNVINKGWLIEKLTEIE